MTSVSHQSKHFEFAEFADIAISTQTQLILNSFLHESSVNTVISLAKFEQGFLSALTAIFGTFTSLLLPPRASKKLKAVFVSEEMFSMAKSSSLSWLDCLIPGAQSEVLRLTVKDLINQLWSKVTSHLVAHLQPLTVGGEDVEAVLSLLRNALQHQDLEHHTSVKKCLWFTISAIEHQQSLSVWDQGFQSLLVVSPQDTRRKFKPAKTSEAQSTQSVQLFLTRVLPPLENPGTQLQLTEPAQQRSSRTLPSAQVISYHIDELRLNLPHTAALQRSIEHIARYLSQGLNKSLASMNMRSVGQLLMVDSSLVITALSKTILRVAQVSCPRYGFPQWSRLHSIECCSRAGYDGAYRNYSNLKDTVELMFVSFNNHWQQRCAQVIRDTFPKIKFWKSLNKRGDRQKHEPESYCNELIEALLLPVVEAAIGVTAESAQLSFLMLTICIFLSEMRKVITANKKLYSSSAGRQLLVDFRHIRHWLTSQELGLPQEATQLLSNLPPLSEMERGLLELCGTADQVDSGSPPECGQAWRGLTCANLLSVCRELAWVTDKDWMDCAL